MAVTCFDLVWIASQSCVNLGWVVEYKRDSWQVQYVAKERVFVSE